MQFCSKCGKEIMDDAVICPGCGCAVQNAKAKQDPMPSYEKAAKGAGTTNIIAGVILLVGIVCALLLNVWIGAVLCLVSEILFMMPNSKIQKLFKTNNTDITDKKEFKAAAKKLNADLKKKYTAFKLSYIMAYIALACLLVVVFLGQAMGLI